MGNPIVFNLDSRSVAAEQFRNIRTSISFADKNKEPKTILVISSQPKDGKSFISLNLAASYALLDKKTVVLEFDLRRPNISKTLGIEQKRGISNILAGNADEVDNLLIPLDGYNNNLYILPAGELPPNPAELILGERMQLLVEKLKHRFEYIIIDTPPFSLMTDAALLQLYGDLSVCVLRQNHTFNDVYSELKLYKEKHPEHPLYILLNDVGKGKRYQNTYGNYKIQSHSYYHSQS